MAMTQEQSNTDNAVAQLAAVLAAQTAGAADGAWARGEAGFSLQGENDRESSGYVAGNGPGQ